MIIHQAQYVVKFYTSVVKMYEYRYVDTMDIKRCNPQHSSRTITVENENVDINKY